MKLYSSFLLTFFCFWGVSLSKNQNRGFSISMELIGPDSSKSPFYNSANIVNHSINRVRYLNRVFSLPPDNMPQSTITPYMGFGYAISYSIGTPPFQLYGIIDTASELNWFQCKPCKPCLNQTSPMFDPSKSSTHKIIPCSSPTCDSIILKNCSSDSKNKCEYNYSYFDGSESKGDISVDTLTFTSHDGSPPISFPRFVIGCGHKNKVPALEGSASGIIGMSRRSFSLISQLGTSVGEKFSYCLVPLFSKANISSKLNFGDNAVVYGLDTVSIPLDPSNDDYVTTLEAFSVGHHIIRLNKSLTHGRPNTLIDSGSTLTTLPKYVYSRLESEVAAMVKLKRVKDPTQQFSLCYKTTLDMLKVPIITAHFSGANIKLNALNTFIPISHEVVCFAFIEHAPHGVIIGSVAQQNFLVGFDLQKNIVSFKPTDCTKS